AGLAGWGSFAGGPSTAATAANIDDSDNAGSAVAVANFVNSAHGCNAVRDRRSPNQIGEQRDRWRSADTCGQHRGAGPHARAEARKRRAAALFRRIPAAAESL